MNNSFTQQQQGQRIFPPQASTQLKPPPPPSTQPTQIPPQPTQQPPPPPPTQPQQLPPPTQPQQLPQQQQQPSSYNIQPSLNDLTNFVSNMVQKFDPSQLSFVNKNINNALEKINDKCLFNHNILQIPDDRTNELLMQFKQTYRDYQTRSLEEKNERVFKDFCPACIYIKFGLISDIVTTDLRSYTCSNKNNFSPESNTFNVGSFIHVYNPYKNDNSIKGFYGNNEHPAEKMAFPRGTLLIPTGKILIQLLNFEEEVIAGGIKIVQIMSEEKDISDLRYYLRFFSRNNSLKTGYYGRKHNMTADELKKMNKTKTKGSKNPNATSSGTPSSSDDDDDVDDDVHMQTIKKLYDNPLFANNTTTPKINIAESNIGVDTDDDANFNFDNVFQNGEPLQHISPKIGAKADDIKMKIFDLNPVFVTFLQSIINIQSHVENMDRIKNHSLGTFTNNKDDLVSKHLEANYISLYTSTPPVSSSVFYDMLMMGFYNEMNIESLTKIAPFNESCVLGPQNILLVNRNGDCIMKMDQNNKNTNTCSLFNKILRNSSVPHQQKNISTSFPHNVNAKGIPPPSKFPSSTVQTIQTRLTDLHTQSQTQPKEIPESYKIIYDYHKNNSQHHHNYLRNNCDKLKNYFCKLKDDMNNDIQAIEDNYNIIYIAMHMFPQSIVQSTHNEAMYSLDFTRKADSKPVLKHEPEPNCTYAQNIGFFNLTTICNNTALILKNSEVYLENLIKRDSEGYVNKTSDNCGYNDKNNSDNDITRTFSHVKMNILPQKRKIEDTVANGNVIDLINKTSNGFDFSAYMKKANCPQGGYSFDNYVAKYSDSLNNPNNCQRKF